VSRRAAPVGRAELAARTVHLLNRGNRRNPDVLLVQDGARQIVVKDFAPRGALVRATLGRWITAREAAAYVRLEGHPNVPRFLGWVDPLAIALEHRPGRRISRHLLEDAGPGFVSSLARAVEGLHRRGLVHLDLGHRSNVLVGEDGEPILIDFASAIWFRPGGAAARWILPRLAEHDRRAVAKWIAKLDRQRSMRGAAASAAGAGSDSGGSRKESRPT
jgi:hypothetical protein